MIGFNSDVVASEPLSDADKDFILQSYELAESQEIALFEGLVEDEERNAELFEHFTRHNRVKSYLMVRYKGSIGVPIEHLALECGIDSENQLKWVQNELIKPELGLSPRQKLPEWLDFDVVSDVIVALDEGRGDGN